MEGELSSLKTFLIHAKPLIYTLKNKGASKGSSSDAIK